MNKLNRHFILIAFYLISHKNDILIFALDNNNKKQNQLLIIVYFLLDKRIFGLLPFLLFCIGVHIISGFIYPSIYLYNNKQDHVQTVANVFYVERYKH